MSPSFSSRMMKSSLHAEEDDFVPELHRSIHPRERPDWEETLNAMARGADIPEISGELSLRTCGSTASMKVKNVKKLSFTKGHFPKMAECAHFHYENVDFGNIQQSYLIWMVAPGEESYGQSRQHTKKERHHPANKSASSQGSGFPSCNVWL
uniref:Rho GTPase-activating protein 32 n=1 Tax=Laticauda laticaudata TaxID=8630 RepID=A0A8C5SUB6_LATLA